jgi:hypothetical protein
MVQFFIVLIGMIGYNHVTKKFVTGGLYESK